MSDIDITDLIASIRPADYSASVAERGPNAGRDTWATACRDALALFGDEFDRDLFDLYFEHFGAWDAGELAAHTDDEAAALMLQFIAGDLRDADFIDAEPFSDVWWQEYEKQCEAGVLSGRIGRGVSGRILYYIGE